jgi:hypothetical protein
VLINPARNPSIFRRQFPIRLWYPSQHLLRQNPLPRSQFGSRRRFPSAASQRQALVRLACRRQRRRGAARPSSRHCAQPFVLSAGDGEFEYRIKSMNEPHERVVRESELQGRVVCLPRRTCRNFASARPDCDCRRTVLRGRACVCQIPVLPVELVGHIAASSANPVIINRWTVSGVPSASTKVFAASSLPG